MSDFHAIGEGEESIWCHDSPFQIEIKRFGFFNGVAQRIYPGGLSYAAGIKLFSLSENDSIGLAVFHYFIGKQQIFDFFGRYGLFGDLFQFLGFFLMQVFFLHQHAVEQGTELYCGLGCFFLNKHDTIFLLIENIESSRLITGSDNNLEEKFIYLFGCNGINHRIGNQNTAECRNGISRQSGIPCFEQRRTRSNTAGIIVFQYGKSQLWKLRDKRYGCIDVEQVVIRNLFSVKLFEHFIEISEKESFLMRIFSVTQRLWIIASSPESRIITTVEIIENSGIISRRNGKCLFGKPITIFQRRGSAFFIEHIQKRSILRFGSDNNDIFEVLGSSPDKRDTAYIDFFDDGTFVGARSHRFFKRIKIDNDKIDLGNIVFGDLSTVALFFPTIEYTAEDLRVQRFHTTAQNRGITGETFDTAARYPQRLDKRLCTTGRNKFHAIGMQFINNFVQPVFVINRN